MILGVCLALAILLGILVLRSDDSNRFLSAVNPGFPSFRWTMLLVFGLNLGMMCFYAVKTLPARTDVTYPESSVVYSAERSAETGRLYAALDAPPFSPTPYGPLFYSALQVVGRLAGSSADQIRLGGRVLTLLCYLLIPVSVFALLRKMGWTFELGLLGSLSSVSAYFFHRWDVTARPDVPALLFSLLAICFVCWREESNLAGLILAGCACAVAVLFKPSFLAAPLAITAGLAVGRRTKDVWVFLASGALSGCAFLVYYAARGESVIRHMLLIGASPLDPRSAVILMITYLATGLGPVMIVCGFGGFWIALASGEWRVKLLGYYFFFSVVIAGLTLLQAGGDCNYLLEVCVAAAVVLPLAMAKLEVVWNAAHPGLKLAASLLLLLLFAQQTYALRQFAKRIRNFDTAPLKGLRILSTLPYLSVHGKDPQLLDGFLLNIAEHNGLWSAQPVLVEIAQQQFDAVFLLVEDRQPAQNRGFDMLSPTVISALRAGYVPLCRTATQIVLLPKSREVAFSARDAGQVLGEACYVTGDNLY